MPRTVTAPIILKRKQIHFFATTDLYKRIKTARMSETLAEPMRVNQFVKHCVERGVRDIADKKWREPLKVKAIDAKERRYSIHFFTDMALYRKIHVSLVVFPEPPSLKEFVTWCVERGIDEIYKQKAS